MWACHRVGVVRDHVCIGFLFYAYVGSKDGLEVYRFEQEAF